VSRRLALALHGAQLHDRLPLVGLTRSLRDLGWQRGGADWRKWGMGLWSLAVAGALLAWIPADLTVPATGRLEPAERADLFAPRNSVVMGVPVSHGQRVTRGAVLAELRSVELERQLNETLGRLRTVEETLGALRTTRLLQGRAVGDQGGSAQISAQEVELEVTREGLQDQWQLLDTQRGELTLTSPMDGQVVTWDVGQLTARPVRHGEFLLRVARLDGPWLLELDVPESRSGHLLRAFETRPPGEGLRVEYLLESAPAASYRGELVAVGDATHVNASGLPVVPAEVALPVDHLPDPRPGATVHARIFCGRRSLGFVWLHRLYEAGWMALARWF
jgi:hypothetical protein